MCLAGFKTRFGLGPCSVSLYIQGLNLALWLVLWGTGAFLVLQQTAQCPRQAASFSPTLNSITLGNGKKGESRDAAGSVSCRLSTLQEEPLEA